MLGTGSDTVLYVKGNWWSHWVAATVKLSFLGGLCFLLNSVGIRVVNMNLNIKFIDQKKQTIQPPLLN